MTLATILIDPQSALLAGAIIPLVGWKLLRKDPEKEFRRAVLIGASWGLVYCCAVTVMYFRYTDWMFGYMLDTSTFPVGALWPLFLIANVMSGAAAAALSASFVREGKLLPALACVFGALGTLLVVWLPHMHNYLHIGSFADYRAGTAAPFPGPADAQMGMNLAGGIIAVYSVGLIVWTVRRSMKA